MTKQLLAAGAAAMLAATTASAVSQMPADGTIENYALNSIDMSGLHAGIRGRTGERTVTSKGGAEGALELMRAEVYLGYDIARWLTIYGFIGVADVSGDDFFLKGDTTLGGGAGFWAALIDDDQFDIMSTFSRFRVNLGAEYAYTDSNDFGTGQVEAFLTFELLNDMFPVHEMYPSSIGVFAGPVFSSLDLDGFEQDSSDQWGVTVGGSLTFARRVYMNGGVDVYTDDVVVFGAAGIRF